MIRSTLIHQKLTKFPVRQIFGIFKKKSNPVEIIEKKPTKDDILDYYRTNPHKKVNEEISKVQQYYVELRKEREKKEKEQEDLKSLINDATKRARREHEITLQTYDHRSIMINNINILPSDDFKSPEEFLYYFNEICFNRVKLTEVNFLKIIKGFQTFAASINADQTSTPAFDYLLNSLRGYLGSFKDENTYVDILKFMDLYCIEYPELWAKADKHFVRHCGLWSLSVAIELIGSFSNQSQGSEKLYDHVEKKVTDYMDDLTSDELLTVLRSYFNVKRGTKLFIEKLLKRLALHIADDEFSFELDYLLNVTLVLDYLDPNYNDIKTNLYNVIEQRIIDRKEELDITYACAFARSFGFDNGSEKLFYALETMASTHIHELTAEQYKLYAEGFIFTYRISDKNLDIIIDKFNAFKFHFTPAFLAQFSKSLYILEKENKKIMKDIEGLLIEIFKADPYILTKNDAYQLAFCYCLTRAGGREYYKLLELVLASRLNEWGKDIEFIRELYNIYQKSGLCSFQFLKCLEQLKGPDN